MKYDNVYKVGLATVNRRNIRISNTKNAIRLAGHLFVKAMF
jgi:hypothetical protein